MTIETLHESILEAERFLKKANNLAGQPRLIDSFASKEVAEVKRSSMDLSRSLSKLRKSRYDK